MCLGRRKKIRHRLGGEGCEGRGGKKGFGCAGADMLRFHFHRSGSDSGIPLWGSALFPGALLGACPGAPRLPRCRSPPPCGAAPGPAGLPLPLARTPPEGLGSPAGGRGQAAEPSPFPQTALRAIKPTEWARKARLWETCGGSGRDLRVKAKLKDQQPQLTPVTSTEILRLFFFFSVWKLFYLELRNFVISFSDTVVYIQRVRQGC